jgi:hypothetical protein
MSPLPESQDMRLNSGPLKKLATNLSTTWSSMMTKPGIGETNIPTMAKMVLSQKECMLLTNRISMIDGLKGGPKKIGGPQLLP